MIVVIFYNFVWVAIMGGLSLSYRNALVEHRRIRRPVDLLPVYINCVRVARVHFFGFYCFN